MPPEVNAWWQNRSFHNYADYAMSGEFRAGLDRLIRAGYHLLGLHTYFTAGEQEVRAWTIHRGDTAPQAAGVIHTDFERGFIRAETASYDDFVSLGGWKGAREKGAVGLIVFDAESDDPVADDRDLRPRFDHGAMARTVLRMPPQPPQGGGSPSASNQVGAKPWPARSSARPGWCFCRCR